MVLFVCSVDHDGRQKMTFSLKTNVTGQCLMSSKVNFWGGNVKRNLIVSTDVYGKLELWLETKEMDEPVLIGSTGFSVTDNTWRRINLIHQHGRFKLKVDQELESNIKLPIKSMSLLTFLHDPLEFCGNFYTYFFLDEHWENS